MKKQRSTAQASDHVIACVGRINKQSKMEDLAASVMAAIRPYGMTAAASGLVSGPKAASGNPFHFANWPKEWFGLYIAEEFLLADPVPRWARNSGRALTWSELFKLLPKRDPGRKVIEAARQFGFTEGLVVPARSGDNCLGLVSFGGQRDTLMAEEVLALTIIARGAFDPADRLENLGPTGHPSPILTKREIECLSLLVRGHSDREIGNYLAYPFVRCVFIRPMPERSSMRPPGRIWRPLSSPRAM